MAGPDSPLKATEDEPEEVQRAVEEQGWSSRPLSHLRSLLHCWATEMNQIVSPCPGADVGVESS